MLEMGNSKNVCNLIINFKKDTYEKVLDEFSNIYS